MSRARPLLLACLVAALATPPAPSAQPPAKGRKVAFLVGVGTFKHLPTLSGAPQRDVDALDDLLTGHGFEVVKLTDERAGKDAVEGRFKKLLGGDGDRTKALGRGDLLLVALCSHGFTFEVTGIDGVARSEPFVAGHDAVPGKRDMIALNGLIDAAKDHGAAKLFLVDACREETDPNRGNARNVGIGGTRTVLPANTAVLFSCKKGQLSHQPATLKHGLFTFAVLEALKGRTGLTGEVTWADLVGNVGKSFRSAEFARHIPAGREQTPVSASGEGDDVALLALDPRPGDERTFEVADGVRMVFRWVPPGEAQLGSPRAEYDEVLRKVRATPRPDWQATGGEGTRGTFASKTGFWLGKYEVTQDEWVKVTKGTNPSHFDGTKDNPAKGLSTARFPVENVRWKDIDEGFLPKLNVRPGAAAAFGKPGRFVLPHEDEWEYAARGGHADRRPFYWGKELNGSQANTDGSYPYGTAKPGGNLQRTCAVDDTGDGKYEKHPWGLMHMHGNVREWCENLIRFEVVYKKEPRTDARRSVRGGSWRADGWHGRAACLGSFIEASGHSETGFRVAYRLK